MRRPDVIVTCALALAAALAGCGGDDPAPAPQAAVTTADRVSPLGPGDRVVALGEEFLLADLLSLGIRPIASTATLPDIGFQGLAGQDTAGIQVLSGTEVNAEQVAALRPDLIVTTEFVAGREGGDALASIADVLVVPDGASAEERLTVLGARLDRAAAARRLASRLNAARRALRLRVEDRGGTCVVSVATVYPGPSVAAWVTPSTDIPAAIVGAGCRLDPDESAGSPDGAGRVFLSGERLGELDAPGLVLLQNDGVEGEADAVTEIAGNPLWRSVPGVAAGRVVTLDRLGYPGVAGQLRLIRDLTPVLAG